MTLASIRFRLTAWYFCSLAVILTLFAFGAWVAMENSIVEAVDHDLRLRIETFRSSRSGSSAKRRTNCWRNFRSRPNSGWGADFCRCVTASGRVLYRSARLGVTQLGLKAHAEPVDRISRPRARGARTCGWLLRRSTPRDAISRSRWPSRCASLKSRASGLEGFFWCWPHFPYCWQPLADSGSAAGRWRRSTGLPTRPAGSASQTFQRAFKFQPPRTNCSGSR